MFVIIRTHCIVCNRLLFFFAFWQFRIRGTCVFFGNASGPVPPIDPLLLSKKSVFITRPKLQDYTVTREELLHRSQEVFDWVQQGKVKVSISKEFALKDAVAAHKYIEEGKTTGKVVLRVY
jgi:NADPH2:quinone reductase